MRALVLFGLSLVVSASALVEVQTNYHDSVGIPAAERIRVLEEEILAKNPQVNSNANRIIGGALAPANAHPHFAGMLVSFVGMAGNSVCGASLLSPNRLVTAAHCWFDGTRQAWQFLVILGSNLLYSGGERIATSHVIMHPNYYPRFLTNDIAMIYLPRNAMTNFNVRPIRLPNNSEVWSTFERDWAVAAGFGKTSDQQGHASSVVSHVALQVINNNQCAQLLQSNNFVSSGTLCTSGFGGVGICGGDSGGPLAAYDNDGQPFLIGVSSFAITNGCQRSLPSGFARVTSYLNFIHQHM
uniref:Serine protease 19 n=1 Tax=Mamestra configurata TaxID=174822 RepID=C9W8G2_9NEOP|nr:serine protease 19 [Mamestra configurata]